MKKFHILLICSLFTVHCPLNAQQIIYVDISNTTGVEDGTPSHPFNTILEGLNVSHDSDSIAIAAGTYPEDTLLITHCVAIAGADHTSTHVNGAFVLSSKLDTLPVLIRDLWCENILHNDSGYTVTPLTISDCGLQTLNDHTPSVSATGRFRLMNTIVADSIHISSSSCAAAREVIYCDAGGGLWVSSSSSKGNIRIAGNYLNGCLRVYTIAKSDTLSITGNSVMDSLVLTSVDSDYEVITDNSVESGIRLKAVSHSGFNMTGNQVHNGSIKAHYTALSESEIYGNTLLNGGIDLEAVAGQVVIKSNTIHTDATECGIRIQTTAGGRMDNNIITLPYCGPSGLPLEEDTLSVCAVNIHSVSFGGMKGNRITGGAYGAYISAISSNVFSENEIRDSHYGLYLKTVAGSIDSNLVEHCIADGMILDYQPEYSDTNAVYVNYNQVRNNGGHGIWAKSNALMGKLKDPGTGNNIIRDNGGYDLFVETPDSFVDTIWAQNNQWTHETGEEVGLYDIFDASDDPANSLVMFLPLLHFGVRDFLADSLVLYPNPTSGKFQITSTIRRLADQKNSKFQIPESRIEIADFSGKVVAVFNPEPGNRKTELDISGCPAGIYIVRIYMKDQSVMKKMVKF